jgi:hypothetical protein
MQGYQWDSHHQHHATAQAYPTAKQMEGKSLQSTELCFFFISLDTLNQARIGIALKRKYPFTLASKMRIFADLSRTKLRIFISRKISPKVTTISSILSNNACSKIYNAALGNFSYILCTRELVL